MLPGVLVGSIFSVLLVTLGLHWPVVFLFGFLGVVAALVVK